MAQDISIETFYNPGENILHLHMQDVQEMGNPYSLRYVVKFLERKGYVSYMEVCFLSSLQVFLQYDNSSCKVALLLRCKTSLQDESSIIQCKCVSIAVQ